MSDSQQRAGHHPGGVALVVFAIWLALVFAGAHKRARKALDQSKSTLMPDEQIVAQAIQHRSFAFFHRRKLLTITSSRILCLSRGLLGGFKMVDIQWKELADCRIEQNVLQGICGSNLNLGHLNEGVGRIEVNCIPSAAASTIYARAQFEEQAWDEKRRVRQLEEKRAASGGVFVSNSPSEASKSHQTGNTMIDEIQKAKQLLDTGVVTDAEFQEMKAKILGRIDR